MPVANSVLFINSRFSLSRQSKFIASIPLCNDIVIEVLCFTTRKDIALLEKVCRRFQQIVHRFFLEKPYLSHELFIDNPLVSLFNLSICPYVIIYGVCSSNGWADQKILGFKMGLGYQTRYLALFFF